MLLYSCCISAVDEVILTFVYVLAQVSVMLNQHNSHYVAEGLLSSGEPAAWGYETKCMLLGQFSLNFCNELLIASVIVTSSKCFKKLSKLTQLNIFTGVALLWPLTSSQSIWTVLR